MRHRRSSATDHGFTLIELLVVVIIVGILAAIAIPVFLNQRKKAVDASLKADLKNAANAAETVMVDTPGIYWWGPSSMIAPQNRATAQARFPAAGFTHSDGNQVAINGGPRFGYQICAFNPGATSATSAATAMLYDSNAGGLSATTTIDCSATTYWLYLP